MDAGATQIKLKLKPVKELLCTSHFKNHCILKVETLNSFFMVFDTFNDKKSCSTLFRLTMQFCYITHTLIELSRAGSSRCCGLALSHGLVLHTGLTSLYLPPWTELFKKNCFDYDLFLLVPAKSCHELH